MFGKKQKQPYLSLPLAYTKENKVFSLTDTEAEKHIWCQGTSGSGKSWAVCWIILTLLRNKRNFIAIDPHGDLAELVLKYLIASGFYKSEKAFEKLWYIECRKAKTEAAIAYNILNQPYTPFDISSNFMNAVHRAFPSSSGATTALDNLLLGASHLLCLNHEPITRLYDLVFSDSYREMLLKNCDNEQINAFFAYKFPGNKVSSQVVDSTLRRLFLLSFSPVLKNMLSQKENKLDFRSLMRRQTSVFFNLGGLSEEDKKLLGCLLTVQIEQAFMSRADMPETERYPYHILIDEFPVFAEQSGAAFNNIMEQIRKYNGSLVLINQHLEQLPRGIGGALQNAIPIMMKTGYRDSSTITSYFYRKEEPDTRDFFSQLFFPQETTAFSEIERGEQARKQYENQERSEALITLHGQTQQIRFPTLPKVDVPGNVIERVKQEYTTRLLTAISQIASPSVISGADTSGGAAPGNIAKRRVPVTSPSPAIPFQTFVGTSGTEAELHALFSQYGYLTVSQVARILQKSENTARNKLNKLVTAGILETQSLPRTSPSGKTPLVYSLKKGIRKHEFLDHCLATSEILVQTALLPTVSSDLTLLDLISDHNIKTSPIKLADGNIVVPDGIAKIVSQDYEYALYYEVDRNTEFQKDKIVSKLNNYKTLASHCACMCVVFCVVEGGDLRVKTLKNWAADVLPEAYRELFLFAALDLDTLTPETFFLAPIWSSVGHTPLQPLIEI